MADIDQEWTIVRKELADPQWDFRTVDGLSKSTGLPPDRVENLLDEHGNEVRVAYVPDKQGQPLYTLAERRMKLREILVTLRAFITKSVH